MACSPELLHWLREMRDNHRRAADHWEKTGDHKLYVAELRGRMTAYDEVINHITLEGS